MPAPPPARLVLVRHGESTWNAEHRLQGQADPPLSALGREQAAGLREPLRGLAFDHVLSSDLARARETAALAGHPDAPTDPAWREVHTGEWTGQLARDVSFEELTAWRLGEFAPEGGEDWPTFQARVAGATDALRAAGGTWLVFAHGGCVRAATAHVTGAPAVHLAGPSNATVTILELAPLPRLLVYNRGADAGVPVPTEPGGTLGAPV